MGRAFLPFKQLLNRTLCILIKENIFAKRGIEPKKQKTKKRGYRT